MALIITPGAPDADSYVSVADCSAYAAAHGKTFVETPAEAAEAALRVATQWLDNTYRARFPGAPTNTDQALEWPRTGVWYRGAELPSDEIPRQIKDACCEAAIRELAEVGSLSPDLDPNGQVKMMKAGSVQIEYSGTGMNALGGYHASSFQTIDGILSGLIGSASPYGARAVRA